MNTFAQNIQAEDYLDAEQHAELQAYLDGELEGMEIDFDKEFPFSNEIGPVNPTVEVYDEKFVAALAMFDIVNDNGESIFRKIKTNPKKLEELREVERQANLARYIAAFEQGGETAVNSGKSIFEQVESGEDFQVTPLMLAILGAAEQDELIDADEAE